MPRNFSVLVPENMSSRRVADIFSAYSMGDAAFQNGDGSMGPYNREHGEDVWQLNAGNNLWMTVDKKQGTAEIRCRNTLQEQVVEAMVNLFNVSYVSE